MRYKGYIKEYNKNYAANVYRYPTQIQEIDHSLHWHKDYEFLCVLEGSMKVLRLEDETELKDGDVMFINTEDIHAYGKLDNVKKFIIITISPSALQTYAETPETFMKFELRSRETKDAVRRTLAKLYRSAGDDSITDVLYTKAALNYLAYRLFLDCRNDSIDYIKGSVSDDFDCAKSAIIYMHRNFRRDISLNEISNYVGLTPAHFSKYFKDKTECTFSRYLRKIRLESAVNELLEGKTVNAVAESCGFPNVNSFIIACKAEYGKTPMELKNSKLI